MPLLIIPVVGGLGWLFGFFSSDSVKNLMWVVALVAVAFMFMSLKGWVR